jgi:hypothetical protein
MSLVSLANATVRDMASYLPSDLMTRSDVDSKEPVGKSLPLLSKLDQRRLAEANWLSCQDRVRLRNGSRVLSYIFFYPAICNSVIYDRYFMYYLPL